MPLRQCVNLIGPVQCAGPVAKAIVRLPVGRLFLGDSAAIKSRVAKRCANYCSPENAVFVKS